MKWSDETAGGGAVELDGSVWRNYICCCGVSIASLLLLSGMFNIVVDPYLRFGIRRIDGFNATKPVAINQIEIAKSYDVVRSQYNTILLGNSRVDVGLDPQSAAFPDAWQPVYNFAHPGSGTEGALQRLEYVLAHYPLNHVIVGIDFMNFLCEPSSDDQPTGYSTDHRLSNLSSAEWRRTKQLAVDAMMAGISSSALLDSLRTIAAQPDRYSADVTSAGFNSGEAFRRLIRIEGQSALFDQKNREYSERCWRRIAPDPRLSSELNCLIRLLSLCEQLGIEVTVFTYPYHADVLEIFDGTDHWQAFENWKRELTRICESAKCACWDFSVYNELTTEQPPFADDRTSVMEWYWESGHFRSTLGDLALLQMLATSSSSTPSAGVWIKQENIESHLDSIRLARAQYRIKQPERRTYILEIIAATSGEVNR